MLLLSSLKKANVSVCVQDGKCHFNPATVGATDTGYTDIQSKNETALQVAVATVGPISCAMDASHLGFQVCVCVGVWMCRGSVKGVCARVCVCLYGQCEALVDGCVSECGCKIVMT